MERLGGCMCGAARYRIEGEPLTFYACHCTDCQRRSGSAFGLSMLVPRKAVALTQGETLPVEAAVENGRVKRAVACAKCRTHLWGVSGRNPEVLVIRPGTLDDKSGLAPVAHMWTRSKQPWVALPPHVPTFDTQPEDPGLLAKLWRERRN
ncbi:MAG: GFA family protein [Betaproteobacteria bacterium]